MVFFIERDEASKIIYIIHEGKPEECANLKSYFSDLVSSNILDILEEEPKNADYTICVNPIVDFCKFNCKNYETFPTPLRMILGTHGCRDLFNYLRSKNISPYDEDCDD